jgi:hypothetical protein
MKWNSQHSEVNTWCCSLGRGRRWNMLKTMFRFPMWRKETFELWLFLGRKKDLVFSHFAVPFQKDFPSFLLGTNLSISFCFPNPCLDLIPVVMMENKTRGGTGLSSLLFISPLAIRWLSFQRHVSCILSLMQLWIPWQQLPISYQIFCFEEKIFCLNIKRCV